MFEKFTSANAADFRQRYEGTYGFYRDEKGKRLLTQLSYIRENVCVFIDSRGVEYKLFPNAESDLGFDFIPPRSTFYNTADGAMLVERIAARQFQRGLSPKNTAIHLLRAGGLTGVKVGFPALEKIYATTPVAPDVFVLSDGISVALSKQLALDPVGGVYIFSNRVGVFKRQDKHFIVTLDEPNLWRTEVKEALTRAGCTVEVA
jgi:hypothetical protein